MYVQVLQYVGVQCTFVCVVWHHSELLVEGALTALRKNEMHLPKPSKLTGRRHQVRLSSSSISESL